MTLPFILSFLTIRWLDVIDILLVAVLLYQVYYLVKGTPAVNIFAGIFLVYLLWLIVKALNMELFSSILGKFIDVGVIALIIVFQQELRRFLLYIGTTEFVGRRKWFDFRWKGDTSRKLDVASLIRAFKHLSETKTGAIVVISFGSELKFYINTGDPIDAKVNAKLLESIFFKNSPLHDGAVIISNNTIRAARCVLPVTERADFPQHLGMRHRAAVGITETSEAIAIVVSEQTGEISYVKEGELRDNITIEKLKELLEREAG